METKISIPYGAIKSLNYLFINSGMHQFQFLMVRLKENIDDTVKIVYEHFNSLWCD